MIKYQRGIFAVDLRFILEDPDSIRGSAKWEQLGSLDASKMIADNEDPRVIFIQAKRAAAVIKGFLSELAVYTDSFFSKEDKSFMGAQIQWANTIGGGTQYKQNEKYAAWLEDISEHQEELQKLIRIATEKSLKKGGNMSLSGGRMEMVEDQEEWEETWINPLTGEEVIITKEDAVPQTGRSGYKYFI